jgi:hypothetical protein
MRKIIIFLFLIIGLNPNIYCGESGRKRPSTSSSGEQRKRRCGSYRYPPRGGEPFLLSRAKIELFMQCPRCFYLNCRYGIRRPGEGGFGLQKEADETLKREFDLYRDPQQLHALFQLYNLNFVPFQHKDIDKWRDGLNAGLEYYDKGKNFLITGAIDDIWMDRDTNNLIIVDYKTTSKDEAVVYDNYVRQVAIYQWLLKKTYPPVSKTAYFLFCKTKKSKRFMSWNLELAVELEGALKFDISLIPCEIDDSWVDREIQKIYDCLELDSVPRSGRNYKGGPCDYCKYAQVAARY